jgi:hypothetical protein
LGKKSEKVPSINKTNKIIFQTSFINSNTLLIGNPILFLKKRKVVSITKKENLGLKIGTQWLFLHVRLLTFLAIYTSFLSFFRFFHFLMMLG